MPPAYQLLTTIVFARTVQGEHYTRYQLFHAEQGPLEALWRKSKQNHAPTPPDLFQVISVSLNRAGKAKLPFITEYTVEQGYPRLAFSYPALKEASSFTRTIWHNLRHAEFFPPLYSLTQQALEAFEAGVAPELVHFKALYRFAREEGYPVKEQWWSQKTPEERKCIADWIQVPVAESKDLDGLSQTLEDLKRYLHQQTEILIPDLFPPK